MNKDSRKLAVVIPVFNKVFWTQKTITSLIECTHSDMYVIVVNDGSTDSTSDYINDLGAVLGDHLIYRVNEKNVGVNKSWNIGIETAIAAGCPYICVANNDLLFTDGWDIPLLDALDKDGYSLVSPFSTEMAIPNDFPLGATRHTNPVGLGILGACFMFKSELISTIGLVPDGIIIYFGDNWFCVACKKCGLKFGHIYDSYIHHFFCQTSAGLDNNYWFPKDGAEYARICGENGYSEVGIYINRPDKP